MIETGLRRQAVSVNIRFSVLLHFRASLSGNVEIIELLITKVNEMCYVIIFIIIIIIIVTFIGIIGRGYC